MLVSYLLEVFVDILPSEEDLDQVALVADKTVMFCHLA
jgi:hypothetical protein